MKKGIICCLYILTFLPSCNLQERTSKLEQKEKELEAKEQQLQQRELAIQQKEQAQNVLKDSLPSDDSLYLVQNNLSGDWNTRMRCTATTCMGSAIGDEKNEKWNISFNNDKVLVQATVANKITRVYVGKIVNDRIELADNIGNNTSETNTKIKVVLTKRGENTLEGEREIVKQDCNILYTLILTR